MSEKTSSIALPSRNNYRTYELFLPDNNLYSNKKNVECACSSIIKLRNGDTKTVTVKHLVSRSDMKKVLTTYLERCYKIDENIIKLEKLYKKINLKQS
jgi:hypothetical protein